MEHSSTNDAKLDFPSPWMDRDVGEKWGKLRHDAVKSAFIFHNSFSFAPIDKEIELFQHLKIQRLQDILVLLKVLIRMNFSAL